MHKLVNEIMTLLRNKWVRFGFFKISLSDTGSLLTGKASAHCHSQRFADMEFPSQKGWDWCFYFV